MWDQGKYRFGFGPVRRQQKSPVKPRARGLSFESLETRDLLHGGGIDRTAWTAPVRSPESPTGLVSTPTAGQSGGSSSSFGSGVTGNIKTTAALNKLELAPIDSKTLDQQSGLPMLDSLPGAPTTIYLDFNGNFESDWWFFNDNGTQTHFRNASTPVFDTDGNTASFGAAEQSLIKQIWSRVAEDYAPFNINVSTDYYGGYDNGKAVHVVIGGSNSDWLKMDASGISSIGSFRDTAPNTVFVFDLMKWAAAGVKDGDGRLMDGASAIATTASHEAGHAFGLRHQALYRVDGSKITDYNPGGSGWTPIMGDNKASDRTTWNYGTTDQGSNKWQDDMAILGGTANGFGFRPDDHGNSTATADPLTTSILANSLTSSGIIHSTSDWDFFKFTTGGGAFQITVTSAKYGPNLIPIAQLWNHSNLIANADAGGLTQSIIHSSLPAGTYYVSVKSWGDYGDVGQYTVNLSFNLNYMQMATSTTSTPLATETSGSPAISLTTTKQPTTSTTTKSSFGSGAGPAAEGFASTPGDLKAKASDAQLHDLLFGQDDFMEELASVVRSNVERGRIRGV